MAPTGSRKVIGIIFNIDPKWMGGVVYILNAVKILSWLDDERKPHIVLYYSRELKRFVGEIDYPYLEAIECDFPSAAHTYLMSFLFRRNLLVDFLYKKREVDAFFPVFDLPVKGKRSVRLISWYADLQHFYYPGFFSWRKRLARNWRIRLMLKNTDALVLSSNAVQEDFIRFFGLEKVETHIFRFASVIDDFKFDNHKSILEDKRLPHGYYIVSNQFHRHKNHRIVLEALAILKAKGLIRHVVFTGKVPDNDKAGYVRELYDIIEMHNLHNQVYFLGVISRPEQLSLMRFAQAVIQPSLFEGWSTVIEDAISLQTPVMASDIAVNREQLGDRCLYFDAGNSERLAELLELNSERLDFSKQLYQSYNDRVKEAANSFISIFHTDKFSKK